MPDERFQSQTLKLDPLPGSRLLLRFGVFLPFVVAAFVLGLILARNQQPSNTEPESHIDTRQNLPIHLVSTQFETSAQNHRISSAAFQQTPKPGASPKTSNDSTAVHHQENWQPQDSRSSKSRSASQTLANDLDFQKGNGNIRRLRGGQKNATGSKQPEIMKFSMSQIDELITSGNYPFAEELLQDSYILATSLLKIQIELRMALCAELQAHPKDALKYYRLVMQSPLSRGLSDAATLSAARVLVDQGRNDLAASILFRLLIQREQVMSTGSRGELLHSLASCLTPDSTQQSLLHPQGWVIPRSLRSPESLMKTWSAISKDTAEIARKKPQLTVRRLTAAADGIYVSCHHPSVSILAAIQSVANAAKLELSAGKDAVELLSERTSPIACKEFPLDVFMDALCRPVLIDWSLKDGVLNIRLAKASSNSVEEKQKFERAQRFLRLAVTLTPEYSDAPLSFLYLGVTFAELGRVDRAVRYFYTSIEQYPGASIQAAARFNLGKASLVNDHREDALREFYRTVDNGAGPEINATAYMYIGRILLENDLPRDAVTPLARAVAFANGSDQEPDAVVLLSTAYLMHGQMEAANQVLNDHREVFENLNTDGLLTVKRQHLRKQAAFLGSLARFWGSRGSKRKLEGVKLMSSLAGIKLEHMFGAHNALVVGAAYAVLGMDNDRDQIYNAAIARRPTFPLQNRMQLALAGRSSIDEWVKQDRGLIFTAEDRRKTVETVPALVNLKTRFSSAEAAFREGKFQDCLQGCREVQKQLSELPTTLQGTEAEAKIRVANLKLLGLTHQSLGNHDLAIRCFTGSAEVAESHHSSALKGRQSAHQPSLSGGANQ